MQSSTFETGLTYSGDNKEITLRNRWIYVYVYVCVYICEKNQQYIGLATGVLHSSDKMTDICYALVYY